MTPSQLEAYLTYAMSNKFPVLIKGKPGIGKTDIVKKACRLAGIHLIISHPVVSDPTDYKGLPWVTNGLADFIPFGELKKLIDATVPTAFFLDDLGQAPPSVQASVMQLLLAREINGHKISDHVTFIAATNRKEDRAGVTGLLEPVKSRFASIIELDVNVDDWLLWAIDAGMPVSLLAFNRFKPDLMNAAIPSRDIVNTPCPRTIANIGYQQNAGLPQALEFEVFKGAAGEGYSLEYTAFMEMYRNMPNVDQIILNPTGAPIPTQPGILYGLSGALAHRANDNNLDSVVTYLERLPGEISVSCMKDTIMRKPDLTNTRAYIKWSTSKVGNAII